MRHSWLLLWHNGRGASQAWLFILLRHPCIPLSPSSTPTCSRSPWLIQQLRPRRRSSPPPCSGQAPPSAQALGLRLLVEISYDGHKYTTKGRCLTVSGDCCVCAPIGFA